MLNVVVVGYPKSLASAITGVLDLLALAGVTWNSIQGQTPERLFNVRIASPDGGIVRCINGIELGAHMSYDEVTDADILVIPTLGDPAGLVGSELSSTMELLRRADEKEWLICGNCTGTFLLAEAGVLSGRKATTHWGYKSLFQQRYPDVE